MNTKLPQIAWYGKFVRVELKANGEPYAKPTYFLKGECGYHKPIDGLRNRKDGITLYMMSKTDRKNGNKDTSTPDLNLQTSGGHNFTGIKFSNGVPNPYAFGEPNKDATFTGGKANPFFPDNTEDCFLILFSDSIGERVPDSFEVMIIPNMRSMAVSYCRALEDGKFETAIKSFRVQVNANA